MNDKNDLIEKTIYGIEQSISSDVFQDHEKEIIELKDLSSGVGKSIKETVCAFLNTKGGYIFCGVRERDNKYILTGFDRKRENTLIELQTMFFKNDVDVLINLSDYIIFEYKNILDKTVAIIEVRPLSEDLKYLKFEGKYYERILTADKIIPITKLVQHKEYKVELEYSKELSPVPDATINDLDVEKINQFILKINTTGKKETIKKDIQDARDFLTRRYCISYNNKVTVLGMLLFAKDPFRFLQYRSELDCYFETGNDIGRDKKFFQDDVLNLMDDAFAFVWGHIKVGRSFVGGGISLPEFPEKLIREVINNASAHRDYTIDKTVTIIINPGRHIEIKNPGAFKPKMCILDISTSIEIRRIIPGMPETKNPKLANILKAFDKIESYGIGMATLVSVCLENLIDVPYYNLSIPDSISLIIPSGKLMDEDSQRWMDSFYGYIDKKLESKTTKQHELVLVYLLKSERLNLKRQYTILLSPANNHFDVLSDLKVAGLIIEHQISTEQTPIYILDRELTLVDFIEKIEDQTGKYLKKIEDFQRQILNIIYRYNQYAGHPVKPNVITSNLYLNAQIQGNIFEGNSSFYETLSRKVRKTCNDLEKAGILQKNKDRSYEIKGSEVL